MKGAPRYAICTPKQGSVSTESGFSDCSASGMRYSQPARGRFHTACLGVAALYEQTTERQTYYSIPYPNYNSSETTQTITSH